MEAHDPPLTPESLSTLTAQKAGLGAPNKIEIDFRIVHFLTLNQTIIVENCEPETGPILYVFEMINTNNEWIKLK